MGKDCFRAVYVAHRTQGCKEAAWPFWMAWMELPVSALSSRIPVGWEIAAFAADLGSLGVGIGMSCILSTRTDDLQLHNLLLTVYLKW